MLALGSSGHAWLGKICQALKDGDYLDNEKVQKFFDDAAANAREKKIPFDKETDYAANFIASRDAGDEPDIPTHARLYCEPECSEQKAKQKPKPAVVASEPVPELEATDAPKVRLKPRYHKQSVAQRR
jgi:hypothetical protein